MPTFKSINCSVIYLALHTTEDSFRFTYT